MEGVKGGRVVSWEGGKGGRAVSQKGGKGGKIVRRQAYAGWRAVRWQVGEGEDEGSEEVTWWERCERSDVARCEK